MRIIKRYPNRKLYDTADRQYITLERIAEMIRDGADVRVLDHAAGDDLTTLILVQIIVEQEKRRGGFLPLTVLTGLVQAGGHTMAVLRRALAAPLGFLRQADEEIERRILRLVSLGELAEEDGRRLIDRLLALGPGGSYGEPVSLDEIEHRLRDRGVPSRTEFRALEALVTALNVEVEALGQDPVGTM